MEFNVADLLKEGYGAMREYPIDDDVRIDGVTHHLTGNVRLDRTPDGVLVRATLSGPVEATCSRCLTPITLDINVSFDEQYVPTIDVNTGARIEPPAGEEDAYRISPRHVIDLREPIEQYWSMALPMAPRCRADCPGLCPACGKELADGHVCATETGDERWARLRDLRLN